MTERLLRKKEIAAMLGTSPGVAASILSARGVKPIDFGRGRSRGLHWLESAVVAAIRDIHAEAQTPPKIHRQGVTPRRPYPAAHLADMTVKDIEGLLTVRQCVQ